MATCFQHEEGSECAGGYRYQCARESVPEDKWKAEQDEQLSKLISAGNIVLDPAAPLTLKALLEIEITTSEEARLMNDKHMLSSIPLD